MTTGNMFIYFFPGGKTADGSVGLENNHNTCHLPGLGSSYARQIFPFSGR